MFHVTMLNHASKLKIARNKSLETYTHLITTRVSALD